MNKEIQCLIITESDSTLDIRLTWDHELRITEGLNAQGMILNRTGIMC